MKCRKMDIKLLSILKEELNSYMNINESNYDSVPIELAESEEQARFQQVSELTKNLKDACNQYISSTECKFQTDLLYQFGKEYLSEIEDNYLDGLHDKINTFINSAAPNDDNKLLALNRDEVFSCLSYQRLCPICSGMLESCNSGILKRLAVYERCKNSRRSCLSFTTKHRQIWIRVTFTASCPACVARTDSEYKLELQTTPEIERISEQVECFLKDPAYFVRELIWHWVDVTFT